MIESRELPLILLSAQRRVTTDFGDAVDTQRLKTMQTEIVDAAKLSQTLCGRRERRFYSIPAYYDPNKHVIYLNETMLRRESRETVLIICYHELLHAISMHRNYREDNKNIFQSGAKIELYSVQFYNWSNRLLNEGIVQFFTNYYNHACDDAYAYAEESKLMRTVAKAIGVAPLKSALLEGKLDQLQAAFDRSFGTGTFAMFSRLLDKRQYRHAATLLEPAPLVVVRPSIEHTVSAAS